VVVDANIQNKKDLIGKKVSAYVPTGSFSEFVVTSRKNIIVNDGNVDFDQLACGFVAPTCAMGLLDFVLACKAKTIINTACNSTVGNMIVKIIREKKLDI